MLVLKSARVVLAALIVTLGSAASAATVATFGISGSYFVTGSTGTTELSASGTFTGELFETEFDPFALYTFSAAGEVSNGFVTLSESGSETLLGIEAALLVEGLLDEIEMDAELAALLAYFEGNSGALIPVGLTGYALSFLYSDLVLTETTIDGSFDLFIGAPEEIPEVLALGPEGSFALDFAIETAAIPVPAGLPLLAGGLGLLALVRRKTAA